VSAQDRDTGMTPDDLLDTIADLQTDVSVLERRLAAAEAARERAEAWQLAVADGLGYVNRPEGQGGYEVAEPSVIVDAFRAAESEPSRLRSERDDSKKAAREWAVRAVAAERESAALRSDVARLMEALRLKMDEYRPHDPGYCAACDAARAALRPSPNDAEKETP
jgi:post-segregation antitoxin (ccd killing protein)